MSQLGATATAAITNAQTKATDISEISLVLLAVMMALFIFYTAFRLAKRLTDTQGLERQLWLIGSAIAISVGSCGIHLPIILAYHSFVAGNHSFVIVISVVIASLPSLILVLLTSFLEQHGGETQSAGIDSSREEYLVLRQSNEKLLQEIADQQRAEEEVRFLQAIAQAIRESADFHSALGVTLQKICDFTDWLFGEAWIPTADGQTLEYSNTWYGKSQNVEQFAQFSNKYKFTPATGLPGRVWTSKQPEWIPDIAQEPETNFPRKQLASAVGFKAGLGIPIVDQDNHVLAVLVFFMFDACEEDKRLVEIVSTVATQLGSLMQRKQVEEALSESEARLQAILDNSTALIYVKDLEGKYILINSWYGIIFHLERQQVQGKTDFDIFPAQFAEVFRAHDKQVLAALTPLDWEESVLQDDGLHTYLSIKFPLYNPAGEPYAVCGISTDITERKRTENALHSSMATNRALLNAIPDLMLRISRDGIFVNFKAAKDKNLFMPQGEFLGKHLYEVFPIEVAQPIINCVEIALQTGEVQILEYQLLVDNNLLDYELRIAVSAENEVMAIIRDITERKQAEAEIRNALEKEKELNELKTRFISMASHEYRTPLATILSSAELLEHYSHKWSQEKKLIHLKRIQTSVKHMTQLLNDVLLIGKAEAGKLEFKPVMINLLQFCRDLVEEMELTANTHTIAFQTHELDITACIDEKLLRHILSNLLSNAIKYSPQGSKVDFDLIAETENIIFRIQDQGIGIPVAEQTQLFNSFHRGSNVGNITGTGLGLAIVKKSVDLHGGWIMFTSEVGNGTTFTVSIPLHQ